MYNIISKVNNIKHNLSQGIGKLLKYKTHKLKTYSKYISLESIIYNLFEEQIVSIKFSTKYKARNIVWRSSCSRSLRHRTPKCNHCGWISSWFDCYNKGCSNHDVAFNPHFRIRTINLQTSHDNRKAALRIRVRRAVPMRFIQFHGIVIRLFKVDRYFPTEIWQHLRSWWFLVYRHVDM
jgi:hypothetical protein